MSAPTSLMTAGSLGKMPTTSARRLISRLSRSSGFGAARLAAVPAFLRVKVPPTEESSAVVVISSDGEGDRPVGSLDVKAPGGRGNPGRSGAARLAAIAAGESTDKRG